MNDKDQENEAQKPFMILTTPACVSVLVPASWSLKPRLVLCLARGEGKSIIERLIANLRLCQTSNDHSPKAFRIAQHKRDAGGWRTTRQL
jgi:hypothetical protein